MTQITFYQNNRKDQEHKKKVETIIKEFLQTEESKWEMPLERLLLNFMSEKYGSFSYISEEQWKELFKVHKKLSTTK